MPSPIATPTRPAPNDLRHFWSHGQCTGEGPRRLTHAPSEVSDLGSILPMGLMAGAHVTPSDHLGFAGKDENSPRDRYEVRSMADGFIVHIQRRTGAIGDASDTRKDRDEFRVVVEHSCSFWTYYDLINVLDPEVVRQIGEVPATGPSKAYRVPVKGGQVIGRFGGGHGIDWAVVNGEVKLPGFVVPSHYDGEPWKVHTVDPFEYFDDPPRSQLLELVARKASPRGGKIDYDVDGRLVGNWFGPGAVELGATVDRSRPWVHHLSIVYHHHDPSKIVVSLGNYEGTQKQFWVRGNSPDPATIAPAQGMVKYELIMGQVGSLGQPVTHPDKDKVQAVLLVEMVGPREMRVEVFSGKTANGVTGFSPAAVIYVR